MGTTAALLSSLPPCLPCSCHVCACMSTVSQQGTPPRPWRCRNSRRLEVMFLAGSHPLAPEICELADAVGPDADEAARLAAMRELDPEVRGSGVGSPGPGLRAWGGHTPVRGKRRMCAWLEGGAHWLRERIARQGEGSVLGGLRHVPSPCLADPSAPIHLRCCSCRRACAARLRRRRARCAPQW